MTVPIQNMPDAERMRRIRWRARRGLLENDIILTRFLDLNEDAMTEADVLGLDRLLALTDPELLDLVLGRSEPSGALACPPVKHLLEQLRRT